ncbi:MAG TPA: phage tail tube protein [Rhizomicrobium sp.]|jgi:hypothetical protein
MARARGANAQLCVAYESTYGTPPGSGFYKVPFVSANIGDEQDLIASDLLGQGRDPADPAQDVINNAGDIVVPVDLRNFGLWLKGLLGAPTTVEGVAATASWVFSAQPATSATISPNGVDFTFVASDPGDGDILIGATLYDTVVNAVQALNASTDTDVNVATYSMDLKGTTIFATYDTVGTGGNAFTLAASTSPASHATVSGATMSGGAASGGYQHTFASGALTLPSLSGEIGNVDIASYAMNYGIGIDKIAINLARSGLLNATVSTINQGESARTGSSAAGSPTVLQLLRFAQFTGSVTRLGATLGDVVSGNFTAANNLDKVEVIRPDGRIAGVDPAEASYTGQVVIRFKDTALMALATAGEPVDLTYSWQIAANQTLEFIFHRVFLPKPKVPITGPGAVQATFDWQGAKDPTVGRACTVVLCNDVSSY